MRRTAPALIALLVLALGVSSAQGHTLQAARSVEASINALRAEHGCGPLRAHAGLARAAGREARLLLTEGVLDHDAGTPFDERLADAMPSARMWGENLAFGSGDSAAPDAIVDGWLHSPAHREIMLDCDFQRVGIGVASGAFGDEGDGAVYTADFAA